MMISGREKKKKKKKGKKKRKKENIYRFIITYIHITVSVSVYRNYKKREQNSPKHIGGYDSAIYIYTGSFFPFPTKCHVHAEDITMMAMSVIVTATRARQ